MSAAGAVQRPLIGRSQTQPFPVIRPNDPIVSGLAAFLWGLFMPFPCMLLTTQITQDWRFCMSRMELR